MLTDYRIQFASDIHADTFVGEIYYKEKMIADLIRVEDAIKICLFGDAPIDDPLDLNEFLEIVNRVREEL